MLDSSWKTNLQANTGGRKHINTEVNKNKEEKYTKNVITKNYITQSRKYY
jgi:hypothetical protein